jgi:hypothetical protein
MNLENSVEKIDSQIGFTIEQIKINEIRSKSESIKLLYFDNDLDAHKNIGVKLITLENKSKPNEKGLEFYFKSEFIKVNLSHLSMMFAYLLAQPISLFIEVEMNKDEKLFEEVKSKTEAHEMFKSIVIDKLDDPEDEISSSIWKISDANLKRKVRFYVKYLNIQPFKIKVSYKSDNLNIVNLYKGDLLNYMTNIVDISNLRVRIKEYKIKDKILLEKAVSKIINFYLNDLVNNQKLSLLASVYPIRVTINIMKAFLTLIRSPVDSYMNERYLMIGVYQGFTTFLSQITNEFSDVGSKLMGYLSSWKGLIIE